MLLDQPRRLLQAVGVGTHGGFGERPPFAFVHMRGRVALSEDPEELLRTATEIARRYIGADRAAEFGARNAVGGELVVRFRPERVIALTGVTD